jgi:hypothetical protein
VELTDYPITLFKAIQSIATVRSTQSALRYGRQYFREVSSNGKDFGVSPYPHGILAYSRILNDVEVVVVMNTNADSAGGWQGHVVVDSFLNEEGSEWRLLYGNLKKKQQYVTKSFAEAAIYDLSGNAYTGDVHGVKLNLAPSEVVIVVNKNK